jgi:hypothetical protein
LNSTDCEHRFVSKILGGLEGLYIIYYVEFKSYFETLILGIIFNLKFEKDATFSLPFDFASSDYEM